MRGVCLCSMIDVLCAGFVCMDMSFAVPRHPAADEKQRASSLAFSGGGPAANAAVQAARLGGRAAFAGRVGDDAFGRDLRRDFADEGVNVDALVTTSEPTPAAAILVKPDGQRTVVSHRTTTTVPTPAFPPARVTLIDGHRPEWTAVLAMRALDKTAFVLDAGSFNRSTQNAAILADHIVASEAFARATLAEAGANLGAKEIPSQRHLEILADHLVAKSHVALVVTLGERGLVWYRETQYSHLPALPVDVIDTNGAGDAFHGAYALALARGLPWHDTLLQARAAATLACTRPGSWHALARADEVRALLAA